jgi:AraC-like DNA-binding protein
VKEQTRCTTIDISGRIEVLHARYYTHAFSPHWHEEYAIGLIDAGIEQFQYQGCTHRAGENELVLLNAGDVHTGEGADERGFGFRMLYIPESSLREAASPGRHPSHSFHFRDTVLNNHVVAKRLLAAHHSLEGGGLALEVESLFLSAITGVLETASSWSYSERLTGAPSAILTARDYLHDHLYEEVSLAKLSETAGISKFHFLRAFKNRFGLPPHAYQLQQRMFAAKRLLRNFPSAEVAYQCGFVDQSHFHRVFRALVGITPGRYAQQFRPILR